MKGYGVTRSLLKEHYHSFVTKMNNLALMDPTLTTETKLNMFLGSLNPRILVYIGDSWKTCANIDKLFQIADASVDSISRENAGEREHVIPFNAKEVHNKNKYKDETPTRKTICYHCGRPGHAVFECRNRLAGRPQTAEGAAAFARFCKLTGKDYEYDASKFKRRFSIDASSSNDKPLPPSPIRDPNKPRGVSIDKTPKKNKSKSNKQDKSTVNKPHPSKREAVTVTDDEEEDDDVQEQ
jgi:RNase P subunit RPR2